MKKLSLSLIATFMLLSIIPTKLNAATETNPVAVTTTAAAEAAKDNSDLARLNEIKAMDLSTLSRSEKKELRKEVRAIKDDQDERGRGYQNGHGRRNHDGGDRMNNGRHGGGTVYFMGGGGLLIILLIILLI